MIDPNAVSTIRVGELSPEPFSLTDNVPHEVGTELKRGTIEDLATFISAFIGSTDGVGFRAISITDGQTLPTTTQQEFILVGKGTYYNVVGGSTIICTEELNAIVSNGSYWFIGVEIPINVELAGITQFIRDGFINTTPSEDTVHEALALKANLADSENITNKQNSLAIDGTGTKYPTVDAVFDALATKAPISSVHNPVTLGTENGLSLATQQLSLGLASSGTTGALSGTDWNTFNNKQNTLTNPITGSLTTGYIPMASGTNSLSNSILRNSSGRLFNGTDDGVNTFQFTGSTRILSGNLNIDPDLALVWGATGATNFARSYYNATSKKLIFTKSNGVNTLEIEESSGNVNVPFNLSATTYIGGATLTGTPTAPTAPAGTNTTQIATTAFVLANSSARPYKVYTALLSQAGTNAPVATVLENTLGGTVVWSRSSTGIYIGTLSGAFTVNKTLTLMNTGYNVNGFEGINRVDVNSVQIQTYTNIPTYAYADGRLANGGASIEIRVYN